MDFLEVLDLVVDLLRSRGRVTYGVLKLQFQLDDTQMEVLKDELIYGQRLAIDEDGRVLVWTGETSSTSPSPSTPVGQSDIMQENRLTQTTSPPAQPPTPDAERRQLTVLFCDLVDSTPLASELDPEDWREVLRAYQDTCARVITRFDGHIAQYLGDGLLVYFGYPLAHEDDTQRAVRAGLGILEALGPLNTRLAQERGVRLAARLGIHTGLVVVGEVGGDCKQEQLALGEAPNLAARLQALAAPNSVVINAATLQLLGGFFVCEPLGTPTLKGLAQPLAVYRVLSARMARSRLEAAGRTGLTPMVGREREIELLAERWTRVRAGTGQVVLLSGEAGIGKSRLVEVLKAQVAAEPRAWLMPCQGSPYHQNSALYPVIDVLERVVLRFNHDMSPAQKLSQLEAFVMRHGLPLEEAVPQADLSWRCALPSKFMLLISIVILVATGARFQNRSPHTQEAEASPNQGEATSLAAPTLGRTDFMSGLNRPWDMAFTPDGAMLFTEKCDGLSVRRADGSTSRLFGTTGSAVIASDLFCEGQSGMHGVAIDPDFASNRTLYVYMASNLSTHPRTNRVVRLTVDSGYTTVANRLDIITDISYKDVGNSWSSAGAHSGGRIRFGADGFLYVTTGDNHNGPLPQDLTQLGGKVLRVDRHGNAAPGNQTPEGGDARIFTYGHRNVQGIAFHPTTGQPYIAEHGPGHSDEVTPLTAGGNGGWDPKPEAGVSCADDYCGYISNKPDGTPTPMTDTAKFPNAMQPIWVFNDSQGMGPCTFLTGSQWKGWNDRLVVGIMAARRLDVLQLDSRGALVGTTTADLPAERIRSVVQGPDGNLYVATDGGNIWRVTPQ